MLRLCQPRWVGIEKHPDYNRRVSPRMLEKTKNQTITVDVGDVVIVGGAAAWTHKGFLLSISLDVVGGYSLETPYDNI